MGIVEPQKIEEDMTSSGKGIDLEGHDWFWEGTERNRDGELCMCRKESMPSGSRPGSRGRERAPKGYSFLSEALERERALPRAGIQTSR